MLKYIKNQTKNICKAAVIQNENALRFVSTKQISEEIFEEIFEIIVAQDGWNALEYVPVEKRSDKICKIAVTQNGYALNFVPIEKRSKKICKIAVTQNGYALRFVPEKYQKICK